MLKKFFKSTFIQIFAAFLVVGILPVMILSLGGFSVLSDSLKKTTLSNTENIVMNITGTINKDFGDIYAITDNFLTEDRIEMFSYIDSLGIMENKYYEGLLEQTATKNKAIENIILVNKHGFWTFKSGSRKFPDIFYDFNNGEFIKKVRNQKNEYVIIPNHSQEYFQNVSEYVVSVCKNYYDENGYAGSVIIDVGLDYFASLIQMFSEIKVSSAQILSGNNMCIFSTDIYDISEFVIHENIPVLTVNSFGTHKEQYTKEAFYLKYGIEETGWYVFVEVQSDEMFAEINILKKGFLIICPLILLLLIVISFYFSSYLSSPIKQILTKTELIKKGNLDIHLDFSSNNEVKRLSDVINYMTHRLKEAYSYKISQKETEMNTLKMQVKPHYLYNSLEVIRMTAKGEKAYNAEKMLSSLSKQMRYIIDDEGDIVTLKRELDMVQNYFDFVKYRYSNKIILINNISEELYSLKVPKLIIQPLVENCFKHGIKDSESEFKIILSGTVCDGEVEITVFDNGKGISGKRLEEIMETLETGSVIPVSNIGLKSVHERIRLLCGENYGISVESAENIGTVIRIILPVTEVEKND